MEPWMDGQPRALQASRQIWLHPGRTCIMALFFFTQAVWLEIPGLGLLTMEVLEASSPVLDACVLAERRGPMQGDLNCKVSSSRMQSFASVSSLWLSGMVC